MEWIAEHKTGKARARQAVLVLLGLVLILTVSPKQASAEIHIPFDPHVYEIDVIKPATSTEEGLRRVSCKVCLYSYMQVVPAGGHAWGPWLTDVAATCTTPGNAYRLCETHVESVHYEQKVLPALSSTGTHTDHVVSQTPVTCTSEGIYNYQCSVCGVAHTQLVAPLGHLWGEWTIDTNPGATTDGLRKRICTRDGSHVEYATIPPTGKSDEETPTPVPTPETPTPPSPTEPDAPWRSPGTVLNEPEIFQNAQAEEVTIPPVGEPPVRNREPERESEPAEIELPGFSFDLFGAPNTFDAAMATIDLLILAAFVPLLIPLFYQRRWIQQKRALVRAMSERPLSER